MQESPEGITLHQGMCSAYREQLAVCVCCTDVTQEELSSGPEGGACRPGRGDRGPYGEVMVLAKDTVARVLAKDTVAMVLAEDVVAGVLAEDVLARVLAKGVVAGCSRC